MVLTLLLLALIILDRFEILPPAHLTYFCMAFSPAAAFYGFLVLPRKGGGPFICATLFVLFIPVARLLSVKAGLLPLNWESLAEIVLCNVLLLLAVSIYKRKRHDSGNASTVVFCLLAFLITFVIPPILAGEPLRSERLFKADIEAHTMHASENCDALVLLGAEPEERFLVVRAVGGKVDEGTAKSTILGARMKSAVLHILSMDGHAEDTYRLLLETIRAGDRTPAKLLTCDRKQIPNVWTNALSPRADCVALRDGTPYPLGASEKQASPVGEDVFLHWLPRNELVVLDPAARTVLVRNTAGETTGQTQLESWPTDPLAIALSPEQGNLVYWEKKARAFQLVEFSTGRFRVLPVGVGRELRMKSRPLWVDETRFLYVTMTHSLCEYDTAEEELRQLSQVLDIVSCFCYAREAKKVFWASRMDESENIHAKGCPAIP